MLFPPPPVGEANSHPLKIRPPGRLAEGLPDGSFTTRPHAPLFTKERGGVRGRYPAPMAIGKG